MSTDIELSGEVAGIDRRDFIRKSAIVGGMVWAAPVISSMGSPAFAFTPQGQKISYAAFIVDNASAAFKYEANGTCGLEDGPAKLDANCGALFPVEAAEFQAVNYGDEADEGVKFTIDCSNPKAWIICPLEGYSIRWVIVKSGARNPCSLFAGAAYPDCVTVYQKSA